jgi:hypothetical protein
MIMIEMTWENLSFIELLYNLTVLDSAYSKAGVSA